MRPRTRRFGITTGVLALLVSLSGAISAGAVEAAPDERYQSAELRLGADTTSRATAFRLRIDYVNPDDPEAKPPAVRKVVEILPRGSRINTRAPARCNATDAELMAEGAAACPRRSVVGTGFIKIDTGVEGPGRYLEEDVTFLNDAHELIFLNEDRSTGQRVVTRSVVKRRKVISRAPFLPGTPPDGAAIDRVRANFPKLVRGSGSARKAYVTTPGRCPDRGYWVSRVRFTYDDETTQTERTRNRCSA